jgi:uncharacterized protein
MCRRWLTYLRRYRRAVTELAGKANQALARTKVGWPGLPRQVTHIYVTLLNVSNFVGREKELELLNAHLADVENGQARLLAIRGRRQVGKSRLITEFVRRAGLPQFFVTGSLQATRREDLALLVEESVRTSTLPGRDVLAAGAPSTWDGALRLIAAALPADGPAIIVLDELPWFIARDSGLEGTLQVVWDRVFEAKRVLMIIVGSDTAMMEALSTYGRPLFGRTRELTVRPFHAADTSEMLPNVATPADVVDFQLVTGGFPRLVQAAAPFATTAHFVKAQLEDENSALCANAARVLEAEVPDASQASPVLRAIGSGDRTFRNIAHRCGLADQTVQRALVTLLDKHLVARDVPASVPPSEHPRYRIDDSYLRFWLALVAPGISEIQRGRPDLAQERFASSWSAWRGRAVEPLIRDALFRLAATDERLRGAAHVSGWWPRNNNPEVDLVGVDRWPRPASVCFVGSIKWREESPFTTTDLRSLERDIGAIPGVSVDTPRVTVARSRVDAAGVVALTATDIVSAWRPPS